MTKKNGKKFRMVKLEINLRVTDEDIDDIMSTALDSMLLQTWCSEVNVVGKYLGEYASEQISRGGEIWLYDMDDESYYSLDKEKLLKGIKKYISMYGDPTGFLYRIDGELGLDCVKIDELVSDCMIQCSLFDDIVYG